MKPIDPKVPRGIAHAAAEAPESPEAVDPWLLEEVPGSACPFCRFGPLTRFESMNGRCERCRQRYLDAAGERA